MNLKLHLEKILVQIFLLKCDINSHFIIRIQQLESEEKHETHLNNISVIKFKNYKMRKNTKQILIFISLNTSSEQKIRKTQNQFLFH